MEVQTLRAALSEEIRTLGLLKKTTDPPVIRWRLRKWALICTDSGGMLQRERGKNKLKKLVSAKKKINKLPEGVWMRHFPLAAANKEYGERYLKAWVRFTELCNALDRSDYPAEDGGLLKDIRYCALLKRLFAALTVQLNNIQYHRIGESGKDYFERQLDTVDGLLDTIEETMNRLGDCIQRDRLSNYRQLLPGNLCTGEAESAEQLKEKLREFVGECERDDHRLALKPKTDPDGEKKEADGKKADPGKNPEQPQKSAEAPAPAQILPAVQAAAPVAENDRRLNVHLTLGLQVDGAADVTAGTQQDKGESE